jgi:hypothetical protein
MIMKGRAPLRLPSVGVFTLAVLAMVALPGWATRAAEETPQQPQAAQSTARAPETTTSAKPTPVPARAQTVRPTKEHTVSIAVPQAELARPQTFTVAPLAHDQKLTRFVTALLDQQTESPKVILGPQLRKQARWVEITAMTDEAQNLVKGFDADRDAIQKEANAKVQARRDAAIKDLEALQDQYAKAGKLDEAVAIRNFLKAGGPSQHYSFVVKRKP